MIKVAYFLYENQLQDYVRIYICSSMSRVIPSYQLWIIAIVSIDVSMSPLKALNSSIILMHVYYVYSAVLIIKFL